MTQRVRINSYTFPDQGSVKKTPGIRTTKPIIMKIDRRKFIKSTTKSLATASAFSLVPASVFSKSMKSPSDLLNIAIVGVAGRGRRNLEALKDENIVAMCDVDWGERTEEYFKQYPKAKRYKDYRKMFDQQNDIDAVVISTPDHTHAVIAMEAMRRGKHVYCEKPLAHTIYESRMLAEAAKKYNVQTQMGNQGHSWEEIRLVKEWVEDGLIGDVREVHAWSDRPSLGCCVFSYGMARPEAIENPPETLDWDLWLGPAQHRPYNSVYEPFNWRGWVDFGCGALGDMGCHILDPSFWALDLGNPVSVESSNTNIDEAVIKETYPAAACINYDFPARNGKPPVKLHWYDGALLPPIPEGMETVGSNGAILVGEKGKIIHGSHGARGLKVLPEKLLEDYQKPEKTIPRVDDHHLDWVQACKGGTPASSNFSYGGPLTEMVLLGVLATRNKNKKLFYDGEKMEITNDDKANELINPTYREGWSL